jgi:hypothetical protein
MIEIRQSSAHQSRIKFQHGWSKNAAARPQNESIHCNPLMILTTYSAKGHIRVNTYYLKVTTVNDRS